jgi:hypothetical protein
MRITLPLLLFAFVSVGLGSVLVALKAGDDQGERPITELISGLESTVDRDREDAAEALAELDDQRVIPALRKALDKETDFHVRLALHYALASQGEKLSIRELINSLRQTGHLGSVYLRRVSGKDYGWDIGRWETWDKQTTTGAYKERARERIRQRPARQEWERFASLYSASSFERFEPDDTTHRLSAEDRKQLAELPTAKAWAVFESALEALHDEGDRHLAAKRFREVASKYSGTYYAEDSRELADRLDQMVKEDQAWKEPKEVSSLSKPDQIAYHVYHLRDVVARQWSQPGYCDILNGSLLVGDKEYNAAVELRELGPDAIPALLDLLEDRRPIRAVGYWRDFHPTRTVLRYQDAAIQILNELLPDPPYHRRTTSSYLSNEDEDDRAKLIDQIRKSAQRVKERPAAERQK